MELLFYRKETNTSGKFFEKLIGSMVKGVSFTVFHDIGRLLDKSHFTVPGNKNVIILIIDTFQELKQIVSIKNTLKDERVLLILPDKKKLVQRGGQDNWYPNFEGSENGFIDAIKLMNNDLRHYRQNKVV